MGVLTISMNCNRKIVDPIRIKLLKRMIKGIISVHSEVHFTKANFVSQWPKGSRDVLNGVQQPCMCTFTA